MTPNRAQATFHNTSSKPITEDILQLFSLKESLSSTNTDCSDAEVDHLYCVDVCYEKSSIQTILDGHKLSAKDLSTCDGFLLIAEQNFKTSIPIQSPRAQTSLSQFLKKNATVNFAANQAFESKLGAP